jgi:hypothetical protein
MDFFFLHQPFYSIQVPQIKIDPLEKILVALREILVQPEDLPSGLVEGAGSGEADSPGGAGHESGGHR